MFPIKKFKNFISKIFFSMVGIGFVTAIIKSKIFLGILGILILLALLSSDDKKEPKLFISEYECLSCKARNTSLKIYADLPEDIRYDRVLLEVYYEDGRSVERYQCYPDPEEIRNMTVYGDKGMEEYFKSKTMEGYVECIYQTENLKKPGKYNITIYLYIYEEPPPIAKSVINVDIKESDLLPSILRNKIIYSLGEIIKQKPFPNVVFYNYTITDRVPVLKCSKKIYEIKQSCADSCYQQSNTRQENIACTSKCEKEEMERYCESTYITTSKDKKFVIVNYAIAIDKKDLEEKGLSCNDIVGESIEPLASLSYAGICLVPVTINLGTTITESIIEILNNKGIQFFITAAFGLGLLGEDYEFAIMDEWDQVYAQYNFQDMNRTQYDYLFNFDASIQPLVFLMAKDEEPRFLISKRITSGLLFFIIPISKEDINYAVKLY